MPRITSDLLNNETAFAEWRVELQARLNSEQSSANSYDIRLGTEESADSLILEKKTHGIGVEQLLPLSFFNGAEYSKLCEMGEKLDGLLAEDAYIKRGEKIHPVKSFRQALDWLMDEAKRGQHIQRYKGLGEMNPEQLWETTMDVENRRLLQVRIEDAVSADQIFTTLMGDQVEPRREFIEEHALAVENLDV